MAYIGLKPPAESGIWNIDITGNAATANNALSLGGMAAAGYAPLASPALSGVPTVPTAVAGTNTDQIASTAFVSTAVANLVATAPATLNTLNELALALGSDPNFATTVTNSLALKAPLTGVGTSGTWPISVTGNAATATYVIQAGTAANNTLYGDNSGWSCLVSGNSTAGAFGYRATSGSTIVFTVSSTGAVVASGDITAFSDIRLKTNITTLTGSLNRVCSMRGVEFDKDGKRSIGVIAQEMREICPAVVHEGTDDMRTLSVAYGNIVAELIEAIKELKLEIDILKVK